MFVGSGLQILLWVKGLCFREKRFESEVRRERNVSHALAAAGICKVGPSPNRSLQPNHNATPAFPKPNVMALLPLQFSTKN